MVLGTKLQFVIAVGIPQVQHDSRLTRVRSEQPSQTSQPLLAPVQRAYVN